jgi:hypothetical protein
MFVFVARLRDVFEIAEAPAKIVNRFEVENFDSVMDALAAMTPGP